MSSPTYAYRCHNRPRVVGLEIDFEILVPRQFGADLGGGLVIGVGGLGVRVSRVDEGSDPLRAQA